MSTPQLIFNTLPAEHIHLPAKIGEVGARDATFTVMTANVEKVIKNATMAWELENANNIAILFEEGYGISARLLKELVGIIDDSRIVFHIDFKVAQLELKHGNSKTTLKLKHISHIGMFSKPIVFDFENFSQVEYSKLDTWIKKAVSKNDNLPESQAYKTFHHGNIATDGYRVHYATDLQARTRLYPIDPKAKQFLDDARNAKNSALVNLPQLLTAVKQAKAIHKKEGWVTLQLGKRGQNLVVSAYKLAEASTKKGNNATMSVVKGNYKGDAVETHVNPTYLLDALAGMKPNKNNPLVRITIQPAATGVKNQAGSIFFVSDGVHEAVIAGKTV